MSKNDYVKPAEYEAPGNQGAGTAQFLRKAISQDDSIKCKDFRLCGVEVLESICYSADSLEVKEQNLKYLEEMYEAEKEEWDSTGVYYEDMVALLELFHSMLDEQKAKADGQFNQSEES